MPSSGLIRLRELAPDSPAPDSNDGISPPFHNHARPGKVPLNWIFMGGNTDICGAY